MPLKHEAFNEYLFGAGYGVGLPDAPEGTYWKMVCRPSDAVGRELTRDTQGNDWYLKPK